MNKIKKKAVLLLIFLYPVLFSYQVYPKNAGIKNPEKFIEKSDAVFVTDEQGKILFSKNPDKKLIPASILKIFTSLAAFYYLGEKFRFKTDFYIDQNFNLKIKGYGDPFLKSEDINLLAEDISGMLNRFNNIIVDGSYFANPISIPGVTLSSNPYDAPAGALSVNFNTVFFSKKGNYYVSAEQQTPLLPFAISRIRKSGLNNGRIVFRDKKSENILYAGMLFGYFFKKHTIKINGVVKTGKAVMGDELIYKYISPYSLKTIISGLLEYSNNFVANQLLLTIGAKIYGPKATLKKGVLAAKKYSEKILGIKNISFVEGSGISRKNQVSARQMMIILKKFLPYRKLMKKKGNIYFKTGTLSGIRTKAGYIESPEYGLCRFVVMSNTAGKSTEPILEAILRNL